MKKIFVALSMVAFLAACDDSSSASAENNEPTTLSSAEEQGSSSSSSFTSAGSVTLSSSSRHCEECNDEAISSSIEELNGTSSSSSEKVKPQSSSSEKFGKSSSSVIETSSSSEKLGSSSSVEIPNSSSSELSESSSSSADEEKSSSSSDILSSSGESTPSSSSVTLTMPCKTETEDNCEYGILLDDRDRQSYKTVKIGSQWWMAENLNFETENSWCGGGESRSTTGGDCATYGRLYTWAAAMGKSENECGYGHDCDLGTGNVQGVCPVGWHVPTKSEWVDLFATVGGRNTAGRKLKTQTGWLAYSEDISNEDAYGFAALPAGYYNGSYVNDVGECAVFWSATLTPYGGNIAYYVNLLNDSNKANLLYDYDSAHLDRSDDDGHSVRCVKD